MSKFFQILSYVNHWLNAVDEHSLHSPFFFDFYNHVIKNDKHDDQDFAALEGIRQKLLANTLQVTINDLGAKSNHFKKDSRSLSRIAETSLSPAHFCRLYHRIIDYIDATQIIELGTSMGITTLYLAKKENAEVTTFEGQEAMINVARTNFESFQATNINLVEGNIDTELANHLLKVVKIDFVLMDANHRYEPTMRYFTLLSKRMAEKGVIIVDDIHHSEEMNKAWTAMRHHQLVYGSIDLFRCGILFFDPTLNRQHYTWSF